MADSELAAVLAEHEEFVKSDNRQAQWQDLWAYLALQDNNEPQATRCEATAAQYRASARGQELVAEGLRRSVENPDA